MNLTPASKGFINPSLHITQNPLGSELCLRIVSNGRVHTSRAAVEKQLHSMGISINGARNIPPARWRDIFYYANTHNLAVAAVPHPPKNILKKIDQERLRLQGLIAQHGLPDYICTTFLNLCDQNQFSLDQIENIVTTIIDSINAPHIKWGTGMAESNIMPSLII